MCYILERVLATYRLIARCFN